jgi:hypothetical protein
VILPNTPERVVTSGVLHLGISDHSLVYVVRKVAIKTKSRHRVINIRSMKKFNVDRFKNELTSLPLSLVDNLENANDRWELWKSMFMNVADKKRKEKFLKKSFAFSGAKVWNELPEEVKCSNSLHIFKKYISSHA